jgi:ribonuclease P protein component
VTSDAAAGGQGLPRAHRVRRRAEFLRAQKGGRRLHAAHFTVILFDRGDDRPARLGLVTSRKVGNAVQRNRLRRVLREVFRREPERYPPGYDVVMLAKDGASSLDAEAIRGEIHAALAKRRPPPGSAPRRPPGGA